MHATDTTTEHAPTGAQDVHPRGEPPAPPRAEAGPATDAAPAADASPSADASPAADAAPSAGKAQSAESELLEPATAASGEPSEPASVAKPDRRKLEEQLETLKRKEFELRRALTIADHPALTDAIRELEGRAYAITRAEAKLAQGLSKAEERRRDTLEKKLGSLREKRAELDTQIGELETELQALGAERGALFAAERRDALEQLLVVLGTHEPAFRGAGLDATSLVPEIARFLPEIESLAQRLVAAREAG